MTPLIDPDLTRPDHRILITGGVRSGKSRYGETLLADSAEVTYVATGPVPDPRPTPSGRRGSSIIERAAGALEHARDQRRSRSAAQRVGAIMIDCLGTWLTAVIDRLGTWDEPLARWQGDFHDQLQDLIKPGRPVGPGSRGDQ